MGNNIIRASFRAKGKLENHEFNGYIESAFMGTDQELLEFCKVANGNLTFTAQQQGVIDTIVHDIYTDRLLRPSTFYKLSE